jgi:AraC-like DNA-binding protein
MNQKKTQVHAENRTVPASSVRCLLELGSKFGVSVEHLLQDSGISQEQIDAPDGRLNTVLVGRVTQKLIQLADRSDIGLQYGFSMPFTILGSLGYAVMSCENPLQAILLIYKYQAIHLTELGFNLNIDNDDAVITIEEKYRMGSIRQEVIEALLVGACRHFYFWTGDELTGLTIHVDWPEPEYFKEYKSLLAPWKFQQQAIQIRFKVSHLTKPFIMADPAAIKRALVQVEKEITISSGLTQSNLVPKVKYFLNTKSNNRYPSLKEIAEQLNLSERTLKRKLHDTGYSFQMLLDQTRQHQAITLLNDNQLTIQEIAVVLGYLDPRSFTKAFKRWTGLRPSDFRH